MFGKEIKLFRSNWHIKKYQLQAYLLKKKAICLFQEDWMEELIYGKLFLPNITILLIRFKSILLLISQYQKQLNQLNLIFSPFVLDKSKNINIFITYFSLNFVFFKIYTSRNQKW